MTRPRAIELGLAAVVVLLTLINGAEFFLKRTGVVDRPAYDLYLEKHAEDAPHGRGLLPLEQYEREGPYRAYLFESNAAGVVMKLLKELFVVGLLVAVVACAVRRASVPSFRNAWPAYGLAGVAVAAGTITWFDHGLLLALTGARAFSFLLLAILLAGCSALRDRLTPALAVSAAVLLAVQVPMAIFEIARGLPIWGYLTTAPALSMRMSAAMNVPNSLGAFAVTAFAFRLGLPSKGGRPWTWLLATCLLVFVSNSGTGFVVLAVLGFGWLVRRLGRRVIAPVGIALALSIPLLPVVTGRPDLFDSPGGRIGEAARAFSQLRGAELLIGKAFGAGTNAAYFLSRGENALTEGSSASDFGMSADSLPTMLLISTGLAGLTGFYVLLAWGAARAPHLWPFWIAACLTSMTIKIVELFPVSLFLAAALATAIASPSGAVVEPAEEER